MVDWFAQITPSAQQIENAFLSNPPQSVLSRRSHAEGWRGFFIKAMEKVVELSAALRKGHREDERVVKSALVGVL